MDKKTNEEMQALVRKATSGDKEALETLITGVQDMVFNLSLRRLPHPQMCRASAEIN